MSNDRTYRLWRRAKGRSRDKLANGDVTPERQTLTPLPPGSRGAYNAQTTLVNEKMSPDVGIALCSGEGQTIRAAPGRGFSRDGVVVAAAGSRPHLKRGSSRQGSPSSSESPRCVRIRRITAGSSIVASSTILPLHLGQASTSMVNVTRQNGRRAGRHVRSRRARPSRRRVR
jgi:hypothetical protein